MASLIPPANSFESDRTSRPPLSVVIPAYNEAATLEDLLRRTVEELGRFVDPTIIVCADPGADATVDVARRARRTLPVVVNTSGYRRGYARSVLDGLASVKSEYAFVLDGDGQCDPSDFGSLWQARAADLVIGSRIPRRDPASRRLISSGFRQIYRATLGVTVRDPSCPFLLFKIAPMRVIFDRAGLMPSLWWEVVARAHWRGLTIVEVPVLHRPRLSGPSRALPPSRLARASLDQLKGLIRLRQELRSAAIG